MAPNPYAPDGDANTIFFERTFIAGNFITAIGYGVQLVLYLSCASYLWKMRKTQSKTVLLLTYITILICIETILQIVQAHLVQIIYVDNRNYPGGPWEYFMTNTHLPINIVFLSSYFAVTFLSDLLVLWRCWVIWASSGRWSAFLATSFPALMLLASFVTGTLWAFQSIQPGLSFYSALPLTYGASSYAILLGSNIVMTVLIVVRLLIYRRTAMRSLGALTEHARDYTSLVTIVIESASLYSVFAILFLVTYAVHNPMNQIFLGPANFVQQMSNYMIIYRVAQGRGWRSTTATQGSIMNWAHGPRSVLEGDDRGFPGSQNDIQERKQNHPFPSNSSTTVVHHNL